MPHRPPAFLAQAVAWREQVLAHGDVAPAIRRDLHAAAQQVRASRVKGNAEAGPSGAPRAKPAAAVPAPPASSQLTVGTRLVKLHGGRNHVVEVTADGMLYEGALFPSLSAVAKHITGTHWNGLLFFGLRRRNTYPKRAAGHG